MQQTQTANTQDFLNGVALKTRSGKWRERFTESEYLQMLDLTYEEFVEYFYLFVPWSSNAIITRNADPRSWTALPVIRLREGLRHLIGARVPGLIPKWIGARAVKTTRFVAIDVDNHGGDKQDFANRCRAVKFALKKLGVHENSLLTVPTPGGGRHYFFFLQKGIPVREITPVLEAVGLRDEAGRIEFYPRSHRALRLPFGHNPGKPAANTECRDFVHRYVSGQIHKVNWETCKRLANARRSSLPRHTALLPRGVSNQQRNVSSVCERPTQLGIPKSSTLRVDRSRLESADEQSYRQLVTKPNPSRSDILELLRLGIRLEGTRVDATKRIAFHHVVVLRRPVDEVESDLVKWVYETGRSTSKDVAKDLQEGSRNVEAQTREIVRYCERFRGRSRYHSLCRITEDEQLALQHLASQSGPELSKPRFQFAIKMVEFSRATGRQRGNDWECCPSIHGIVRKWPGCSGTRYKPLMDWAIQVGLIEKVREKRQTPNGTGRARTYLVRVPQKACAPLDANASQQMDLHSGILRGIDSGNSLNKSNRYMNVFISPERRGLTKTDTGHASDRIAHGSHGSDMEAESQKTNSEENTDSLLAAEERDDQVIQSSTENHNFEALPENLLVHSGM